MTPANPDALAARIAELEAENAQLTVERNEALAMRRWNIDRTGDGEVLVCRGYHDKGEDCDHERFVPEAALAAAEARAAQLQAEVEAKNRRIAVLTEAMEPFARFGEVATPDTTQTWAGVRHTERISTRFRHEHFRAARTALAARAATAGEGRSDGAWPSACIKPNACSRHRTCVYAMSAEKCRHFGQDLTAAIAQAEAPSTSAGGKDA